MNTQQYRYHLDKSSRKVVCPQCGRRRFVLYLDVNDRPLDPAVGRCDRQDKCGYHMSPSVFAGRRQGGVGRSGRRYVRRKAGYFPRPDVMRYDHVDARIVESTMRCYDRNSLVMWLWKRFRHLMSREMFEEVLSEYCVGTSNRWGGATVWWQIDSDGQARTGKIMAYDRETGKRIKEPRAMMTWVHTLLKDRYPAGFRMRQAYFGQHLLARYPDARVMMVESEKAALVLALVYKAGGVYGCFVPVACGGCGGLDTSPRARCEPGNRLRSLYSRRVSLLPDQGQYEKWLDRSMEIAQYVDSISVSDRLDREPGEAVRAGDGPDDILLRVLDDPDTLWSQALAL